MLWHAHRLSFVLGSITTPEGDKMCIRDSYNWERIPLVCFKSSHHEIPLLSKVKCLQDAYNNILSNFANQKMCIRDRAGGCGPGPGGQKRLD